jgi:CheY-like chemotaxis protein
MMTEAPQNLREADILLVEDDPGDVLIITEVLETMGHPRRVHVVGDGQQALDYLYREGEHREAARPDLILLDLNMPRMDGREALARIKADPDLRSIPVVVFSTSSSREDVQASYRSHANAYVTKPIEFDDLLQALHKIDEFFTSIAWRSRT